MSKNRDAIKLFGWMGDFTGSGIYRISLPFGQLYKHHPNFLVKANTIIEEWDARTADIIVCQRSCTDEQLEKILAWKKNYKTKLVYELDDDLLNIDSSNEAAKFYTEENINYNVKKIAETADLITTSTKPLANVFREYNENVAVLPNFIDEKVLTFDSIPPDENKILVGWQGSITHAIDFAVCASPLRRVMDLHKEVWLHLFGSFYNPGLKERIYFTPWSNDLETFQKSLRIHIGLAPLRDCKFNESKSHIKMLEYAALGIPAIASNVSAYKDFVQHGITGYLVNNNAEWKQHMTNLIRSPELRKKIGSQAKEYARKHTIQNNYLRWAKEYESLVNR